MSEKEKNVQENRTVITIPALDDPGCLRVAWAVPADEFWIIFNADDGQMADYGDSDWFYCRMLCRGLYRTSYRKTSENSVYNSLLPVVMDYNKLSGLRG